MSLVLLCLLAAEEPRPLRVSGYLQPAASFRYRGEAAAPRERTSFGAEPAALGIVLDGEALPGWSYTAHLVLGAELLAAVIGVDTVDRDGDGQPDDVATERGWVLGNLIEQLTVSFQPFAAVELRAGQMRIPFTAQQQSPNTALMFSSRSGPNEAFLSGTDLGLLLALRAGESASGSVGVFNGTGLSPSAANERGVLWAARLDVHPLGALGFDEADLARGPLRVGLGAGALYYPSEVFDAHGFSGLHVTDVRLALSVRAALRGFYVQAEGLRRQRSDDLSSRPEQATGAYAQASYYVPFGGYGAAPLVRFGWTEEGQGFDPRTTLWNEAGVALYVASDARPDAARLLLQYLREWRLTEGEDAHGAVAQVQLLF